jgi:hypothetical protein
MIRLLPCCFALACAARAGDPLLSVRALDARTGTLLKRTVCALVDGETKKGYAEFERSAYEGERAPRAGDLLYVYVRGYDLARRTLGKRQRELEVRLRKATGTARLRIRGDLPAGTFAEARILLTADGPWRRGPVGDDYAVDVAGPLTAVVCPRGMRVRSLTVARTGLVWPLSARLAAGEETVVNYDAPARIAVEAPDGFFRRNRVIAFPDRHAPAPANVLRVDAWRWAVGGFRWFEECLRDGGRRLDLAPRVPVNVFVVDRRRATFVRVDPGDKQVRFGAFRRRRVAARPLVDGAPAPGGARLAPGHLDSVAMAAVSDRRDGAAACHHELGAPDEPWPEVTLPAAEGLTLWHASVGLVHLDWPAAGAPRGRRFPGRLELTFPEGLVATGFARAHPTWRGTGGARSDLPYNLYRASLTRDRGAVLPFLRPGTWELHIEVSLMGPDGAAAGKVERLFDCEVSDRRATRLLLEPDPK